MSRIYSEATTIAEFMDQIETIWRQWINDEEGFVTDIWFRGHSDATWQLLPRGYRPPYIEVSEHRYRHDFYLRSKPFLCEATVPPLNDWDFYFLMQHYGIPTRLLDWTVSALVSLYFAVQQYTTECAGCVWVLNPRKINATLANIGSCIPIFSDEKVAPYLPALWDEDKEKIPDAIIAIDPPLNSPRLASQKGKFTVHGKMTVALDNIPHLSKDLLCIEIPDYAKGRVRRQLLSAGISESVLFPGLEGLCREIRDLYGIGLEL